MLVTDQAKLIRIGLESLRVIGRGSAGVRLFDVAKGETIVGAVRIEEPDEDEEIVAAEDADESTAPQSEDTTASESSDENPTDTGDGEN
jgi:DNA gyrase subunit A